MSEAPVITISEPVKVRDGRYVVTAVDSRTPGLRQPFYGQSAKEADAAARAFKHGQLKRFYKSLAAKHARAEGRIAQADNARQRAGEAV